MSFTIIVGINGDDGGDDALALARRLAPPDAQLVAVAVAVLGGDRHGDRRDHDAEARHEARVRLAAACLQHEDLRGESAEGPSVVAGLQAAVERLDADLLVIGSCRRGLVGRIFAGVDVRQTVRGASCPVAIAPRDFASDAAPIATIGLGWDGGAEAEGVLSFAQAIADGTGARVKALRVRAASPRGLSDGTSTVPATAGAPSRPTRAPRNVPTTTVTGVAAVELALFAADVDAIVVGHHQRESLDRIGMDSTSETLARQCIRPLVVVPQAVGGPSGSARPRRRTRHWQ